jgi:hypothetical protein
MMHERDYTDREIETILVDSPRRLLTFSVVDFPLVPMGRPAVVVKLAVRRREMAAILLVACRSPTRYLKLVDPHFPGDKLF